MDLSTISGGCLRASSLAISNERDFVPSEAVEGVDDLIDIGLQGVEIVDGVCSSSNHQSRFSTALSHRRCLAAWDLNGIAQWFR